MDRPAAWLHFRAMLKQQFLLLTRYPVNLVANFCVVLISVIVVTLAIIIFAPPGLQARLRGITLYGFLIYVFLSHTIWAIGFSLQKEKVEGTLASLYLTPASRLLSLLARSLVVLAWTTLAGLVGLLIAQALTGPLTFHRPWLSLAILGLTISSLVGVGFAIAGLTLRLGESAEIIANLLEFGLMGLCALFFPFSILPPGLQRIARLIPLSYAVDLFRTVAMGETRPELLPLPAELTIVIITGLVSPLLGYGIYRFNENKMRREGTL